MKMNYHLLTPFLFPLFPPAGGERGPAGEYMESKKTEIEAVMESG
jgi:hypothetical protein